MKSKKTTNALVELLQSDNTGALCDLPTPTDSVPARWYLAYTKPRQEHIAQVHLTQQNFEAYLPLFKKFKKTEQGALPFWEPMFPRYILFRPQKPEQSISTVRHTKGIATVVRFGIEPATLQDRLVQTIRQFEQERQQATLQELSPLKIGQAVRLQHTALGPLEGMVQNVSSKRIAVLLEILGRPTVIQLDHSQVEASR